MANRKKNRKKRAAAPKAQARTPKERGIPLSVQMAAEHLQMHQTLIAYMGEARIYQQALARLGKEDPQALEAFNKHLEAIAKEKGMEIEKVDEVSTEVVDEAMSMTSEELETKTELVQLDG